MGEDEKGSENGSEELSEEEKLFARVEALKARTRVSQQLPEVPEFEFKRPASGPGSKEPLGPTDGGQARELGIGIMAAYTMVGSMVVGFGGGWLADKLLKSGNLWTALGGAGGAIFGIVATMVLLQRASKR
jgi:hypothetical protein